QSLEKTEKSDEAVTYYQKGAKGYPFSKYFEEAKARLEDLKKPVPEVDQKLAPANQAKLKAPEAVNPLKPLTGFLKELGCVGPPDVSETAKKKPTEKQERAAAAAAAAQAGNGSGKPGDDIAITATLKQDPTGKKEAEIAGAAKENPAATDK